jgi:hypothetical protein
MQHIYTIMYRHAHTNTHTHTHTHIHTHTNGTGRMVNSCMGNLIDVSGIAFTAAAEKINEAKYAPRAHVHVSLLNVCMHTLSGLLISGGPCSIAHCLMHLHGHVRTIHTHMPHIYLLTHMATARSQRQCTTTK